MDFRADPRIATASGLRIGARALEQRLVVATQALVEIEGSADSTVRALRQIELDTVRAERDLFFLEHDTTGARKGEVFGRDIRTLIQRCGLRYDENGAVSFADPAAQNMHVLQVNMGELDRLNAVGDHGLGDRGLDATFQHIQANVRRALIEAHPAYAKDESNLVGAYEIYRTAGNDFSVIIRDMDAQHVVALQQELSRPLDISVEGADQDPVPLSVSHAAFEDALRMLSLLEKSSMESQGEDETILVSLLKEKLQTFNDFEKIRTRGERMVQKITQASNVGGMDARYLYDTFLKKYVGSLFLSAGDVGPLSFEQFQDRLKQLGAFDEHPTAWRGHLFTVARDEAMRQFITRNTSERVHSDYILQYVLWTFEEQASHEAVSVSNRFTAGSAELLKSQDRAIDAEAIEAFHARTATLGQTEGHVKITELQKRIGEIGADGNAYASERQRLSQLQFEVECAKRDRATGLYGRSEYVHTLEAALGADTPVTVVAIDMAFLKFFDKEGGSQTGDEAIITAGRILDYVKRTIHEAHGLMIEVYRVGGDEFAMILGTTDESLVRETLGTVNVTTDGVGQIPLFDIHARAAYQPEALQFNFGTSRAASRADIRTQLTGLGITLSSEEGSEAEVRECSDFLIRIADQAVESDKAVNRLVFLLSREIENRRLADSSDGAARQAELEMLTLYSEKAIFGEAGRQKLMEWGSALLSRQKTIADIFSEELIPFVTTQLRLKGKETVRFETGLIQRLEIALQVRFAELRIVELERELQRVEGVLGEEHHRSAQLRDELAALRADRANINRLHTRITDL